MMRYQRVSPDCLHLNNGRKQPNIRTYKDEDASENGRIPSYSSSFDGKAAALRYRSSTTPPRQDHNSFSHLIASSDPPQSDSYTTTTTTTQKNQNHENSPSPSPSRGGDLLLQWGHNKRSRGSRADNRTVTDESSVQSRQLVKLHRRGGGLDKHAIINQQQIMPPPPPPPPPPASSSSCTTTITTTHGRGGGNLRSFSIPIRDATGSSLNRNLEDRSGVGNGSSSSNSGAGGSSRVGGVSRSTEKRTPLSPEKTENTKMGSSTVTNVVGEKQQQQQQMMMNGGSIAQAEHGSRVESAGASVEQEGVGVSHGVTTGGGGEKVNLEVFEWPRIYVSLSRKEKEDDFYAMKGTKLPQRPKKRAKNIDKTLQYCFPGMWLSDLTRGRYEVREKKCVKKQKRRGLKGMESMESDSE